MTVEDHVKSLQIAFEETYAIAWEANERIDALEKRITWLLDAFLNKLELPRDA